MSAIIENPHPVAMSRADKANESRIACRLVSLLKDQAASVKVKEVRIGLGYSAVQLEDQRTGVAYTFRENAREGCSVFQAFRPIAGRPAAELLDLLYSQDQIETTVGLACANALVNHDPPGALAGDIIDHIRLKPSDQVAMIGLFEPIVAAINEKVHSLTIFEKADRPHRLIRPVEEVWTSLPQCQVAVITATAIINHTIDELLEAAGHCREIVILGASTPLLPEAFAHTRVSLLSGVVVTNPAGILQVVSEAGGMRFFRPHIRKVNLSTAQR